ncbi:spermidine synthase [Aureimonas endophytica]|nr:spermidine synthase [Aureimonas endophytica]
MMADRTETGRSSDADALVDYVDEAEGHWFRGCRPVVTQQTAYQKVEIVDVADYGRMLFLDGALQSTEDDEYIYHEALMQPALVALSAPRRVLIIGGGEGASAREALRHPSVERVVMVDLDPEVVALCRRHLPTWHQGAFDDPRFELVIGDGAGFVAGCEETFDLAVVDVVDSFTDGPAEALYTTEFYRALRGRLTAQGMLVVQGMECSANEFEDHRRLRAALAPVFRHARSYTTFVPSFWSEWGFVIATDGADPAEASAAAIDAELRRRCLADKLEFYDGTSHQRMFHLGKDLRRALSLP